MQIYRILENRAIIGLILHRNRKRRFYRFSGIDRYIGKGNGARIGLIFSYVCYPGILYFSKDTQ
jgi:hypothetical protein